MSTELTIKLAIFLIASGFLAYVSRASLRVPRSHGFYRFLTWECILVLFLLVVDRWFHDPFSYTQLISWILMSVSAFLVLHGVYLLRLVGRPAQERPGEPLLAFERTTKLVTQGAYRYIRHPLYSSLLFLTWGIFFKHPIAITGAMALAATGLLIATAIADEAECIRFFGPSYVQYMKRTKMFIPFLF
ncbi:MAG: isoprenylcysteine carboxylmethyltransferase family protein [Anaerolineales bacterium]|nr:isoprenylcysteine carboxylmethyltransferase family protein [Anaerolineales bacterium]